MGHVFGSTDLGRGGSGLVMYTFDVTTVPKKEVEKDERIKAQRIKVQRATRAGSINDNEDVRIADDLVDDEGTECREDSDGLGNDYPEGSEEESSSEEDPDSGSVSPRTRHFRLLARNWPPNKLVSLEPHPRQTS